MESINLNLIPQGANPVVHAKQFDEGRGFRFYLFNGTAPIILTGAETITCNVKKPDGNLVTVAVINTSSNYVDVYTTLQMCACYGASLGEIRLEEDGNDIGTLNFTLSVEESPLNNGIESESAIHDLEQQIADAVADQYDAGSVIFDNTPTTGHGIGYAVTSEGVKQAIDAAAALIPQNITDLQDTDINSPTNGEILVYNNGSWENQANPASTANFAPDYDDTATYNTNDKVIYQGLLYICLEDSVSGAWDGSKWQQISTADYNASNLPISSSDPTNTKEYIDNVDSKIPKIKRYYFIGTTSANKNLVLTSSVVSNFDETKEIIVAVSGRFANATGMVVCTPFASADNFLGMLNCFKVQPATEGVNTANVTIDGYFWTIPRV